MTILLIVSIAVGGFATIWAYDRGFKEGYELSWKFQAMKREREEQEKRNT